MVAVPLLTESSFRALARSSPWRWRALSFDLRRRPLHGPDHAVRATVVRPGRIVVTSPSGVVLDDRREPRPGTEVVGGTGPGVPEPQPYAWEEDAELDADGLVRWRDRWRTADDPMWQDYQFVAMLDPVELADGCPPDDAAWEPGDPRPAALRVHRLEAGHRGGRETWWAEVSPLDGYDPRCSCCPLLWGRVSDAIEAAMGVTTMGALQSSLRYTERYLVALDVGTGVCVHVEHLDGDFAGRGFSVDVLAVDDRVRLPGR